jgi:hypothetical protein
VKMREYNIISILWRWNRVVVDWFAYVSGKTSSWRRRYPCSPKQD